MTLLELLGFVEKRPLMYLKEKNLEELDAFMSGFKLCLFVNKIMNNEDDSFNDKFNHFLQSKYSKDIYLNWYSIISEVAKEKRQDSFNMFFVELNEFRSKYK